jgi:hypothetical protein
MHMTFVSKQCTRHQCSKSISRWMTFVFIPYELMKSKFRMIIIVKSWPMKFVTWHNGIHIGTSNDARDGVVGVVPRDTWH